MSELVELMKASLGPAVALLGVAVAAAQWRTNDVKLRLDSYDRRLRIYKAAVAVLESAAAEIRHRRIPNYRRNNKQLGLPYEELPEEVVAAFRDCLLEAPFLFGQEITNYLRYIDHAIKEVRISAIYLAGKDNDELLKNAAQITARHLREMESSIEEEISTISKRFLPYLQLQRFQK
ncbi:hypothetical protein SE336_20965 [Xanthomonas arboricola]|uniref:hypothetical protein n=1 Tax=Xanthomonas arboricola TaxID=56448 RepID=UPI0039F473D8